MKQSAALGLPHCPWLGTSEGCGDQNDFRQTHEATEGLSPSSLKHHTTNNIKLRNWMGLVFPYQPAIYAMGLLSVNEDGFNNHGNPCFFLHVFQKDEST